FAAIARSLPELAKCSQSSESPRTDADLGRSSRGPRDLELADAAIDINFYSGHVRGVLGSQEGDHTRDFFWFAVPLHRILRDEHLFESIDRFLRQSGSFKDGGDNRARRNRVYTDTPAYQFGGHGSRKRAHGSFRRRVYGPTRKTFLIHHAGVQDD